MAKKSTATPGSLEAWAERMLLGRGSIFRDHFGKTRQTGINLPDDIWTQLDLVAEAETDGNRSEVVLRLLQAGLQRYYEQKFSHLLEKP